MDLSVTVIAQYFGKQGMEGFQFQALLGSGKKKTCPMKKIVILFPYPF